MSNANSQWKKCVSVRGALTHLSPLATVGTQTDVTQNSWQAELKPMNLAFPSRLRPLGTPSCWSQNWVFPPPHPFEGLGQPMHSETSLNTLVGKPHMAGGPGDEYEAGSPSLQRCHGPNTSSSSEGAQLGPGLPKGLMESVPEPG